jgi:hypothetical protein
MQMDRATTLRMPIYERTWMVERMIEQREKENAEVNKARSKK